MPPASNKAPVSSNKKSTATEKKANGYEYNAEDKAQGRYTLYEPNSEKGDDDIDSQPGLRTGVYTKSDNSSQAPDKGRYEDNEELYKDSYEDNEEQQTSNKSKGYYEGTQYDTYSYNTDKSSTQKNLYEDNNEEPKSKGYYDSSKDASYSYNTDDSKVPPSKGSYEDNEEEKETPLKGYDEDNKDDSYSYNTEKQPSPKSKGYEDNKEDSYSYNADKQPSPKSKGYYEDKEDSYSYNTEKEPSGKLKGYYEDSQDESYSYNADDTTTDKPGYESKGRAPKTEYDDGYAYNSSHSEGKVTQTPTATDGYGNEDSYGYNVQSEGGTYVDNSEAEHDKKPGKGSYEDDDYESTDSDHSGAEPFEVHQGGYLQGDDEGETQDGYGAHYKDRTGFYKDNEKPPLDASAPIPVHPPRPVAPGTVHFLIRFRSNSMQLRTALVTGMKSFKTFRLWMTRLLKLHWRSCIACTCFRKSSRKRLLSLARPLSKRSTSQQIRRLSNPRIWEVLPVVRNTPSKVSSSSSPSICSRFMVAMSSQSKRPVSSYKDWSVCSRLALRDCTIRWWFLLTTVAID